MLPALIAIGGHAIGTVAPDDDAERTRPPAALRLALDLLDGHCQGVEDFTKVPGVAAVVGLDPAGRPRHDLGDLEEAPVVPSGLLVAAMPGRVLLWFRRAPRGSRRGCALCGCAVGR